VTTMAVPSSTASAALAGATLCAFDLLQVDGRDLRREPLEARRRALAKLLRRSHSSLVVNEHFEGDGAIVFREACRLGCEGIVSKRLGSPYRSGRTISSAIVVGDRRTTANGGLGRQLSTIARDKGRQTARFVGSNRKGSAGPDLAFGRTFAMAFMAALAF